MEHIGIDLGASRSALCVVSSEGTVLIERTVRTSDIERTVSKRPPSRVAIESCAESRLVAQRVREQGHDVRIVPSVFVRSLGIGTRRIKTDKRDARSLATASFRLGDELPHIHIRSDEAAALQDLVRARSSLVSQRTMAINFVRAQLRALLVQAAHTMLNNRKAPDPMVQWAMELERRRGRKIAVCALARGLAIVMWAMLRDGTAYDPTMTRRRQQPDRTTQLVDAIASEVNPASLPV